MIDILSLEIAEPQMGTIHKYEVNTAYLQSKITKKPTNSQNKKTTKQHNTPLFFASVELW